MTTDDFHAACASFEPDMGTGNGGAEDFATLLRTGLKLLGLSTIDLGRQLEVAPSTISRWSNGHMKPLPRLQLEVIRLLCK